jgi:hypothetical protein
MKKVFLFIIAFLFFVSTEGISKEKKQEPGKKPNVEQTSQKKAKSKSAPSRKRTQKRMQKSRIKNHNEKKTNNMWKK